MLSRNNKCHIKKKCAVRTGPNRLWTPSPWILANLWIPSLSSVGLWTLGRESRFRTRQNFVDCCRRWLRSRDIARRQIEALGGSSGAQNDDANDTPEPSLAPTTEPSEPTTEPSTPEPTEPEPAPEPSETEQELP